MDKNNIIFIFKWSIGRIFLYYFLLFVSNVLSLLPAMLSINNKNEKVFYNIVNLHIKNIELLRNFIAYMKMYDM